MNLLSNPTSRVQARAAIFATLSSALLFVGCASTPTEPIVAIKAAEQAISVADQARIADAASPELKEAREKLAAAQRAFDDKRLVDAERLAIESRVDAELASAKVEAAKAKAVNDEIKTSTATLAQEMQRNSGVK